MIIAGVNSGVDYWGKKINDGGAAIYIEGTGLYALAEERVSRKKHDGGFRHALCALLDHLNLAASDIDQLVVSGYGMLPTDVVKVMEANGELNNIAPKSIVPIPSHHYSHALYAFIASGFSRAIVVVADNEGSVIRWDAAPSVKNLNAHRCERNSYYLADADGLKLLGRDFESPNQLGFGKFYARMTRLCGFDSYLSAGKTMGLSAFASSGEIVSAKPVWDLAPDGVINCAVFADMSDAEIYSHAFSQSEIRIAFDDLDQLDALEKAFIARFAQDQLADAMLHKVKHLLKEHKCDCICLSGGVALNSVLNALIERETGAKTFAPPYPSDEGQCLGNVTFAVEQSGSWDLLQEFCRDQLTNPFLGPEPTPVAHSYQLCSTLSERWTVGEFQSGCKAGYLAIANELAAGKVIGLFQGRSEFGARALGHRSILASPTIEGIKDKVNTLKGRELFRPLAPCVVDEHVKDWFPDAPHKRLTATMLGVAEAGENTRTLAPGAVHVDGTARIQTVSPEHSATLHSLILETKGVTGVPILLNTSFNPAGEPIVETPEEALDAAWRMELDALILDDTIYWRRR